MRRRSKITIITVFLVSTVAPTVKSFALISPKLQHSRNLGASTSRNLGASTSRNLGASTSPYTNSEGDDLLEWSVDESDITPISLIDGDHHDVLKEFSEMIEIYQASIVDRIHAHEPTSRFTSDSWTGDGSRGLTRVIQDGTVVDKGAVSTSYINSGVLSPGRAKTMKARGVNVPDDGRYNAAALSLVLHTRNPHVPTFRSDVRMFQVLDSDGSVVDTWLGGGADLTPYVLYESDVSAFHSQLRSLCLEWDMDYDGMKKNCDEYFYIPCRKEHRGVGGIFFDDIPADGRGMGFVDGLVKSWMDVWLDHIVEERQRVEWTEREKDWQLIRRGRYLEFNLLYDRGVAFGLMKENPRTEGILVSAPPEIKWRYNYEIEKGGNEESLMKVLKEPRDWV